MSKININKELEPFFNNFPLFVAFVWKTVCNLPPPTRAQVHMAELIADPPSNRMILMGFRGVAKSFITCAYVVWSLWRDPQLKVMIVSANKDRSDANAVFIKKIIESIPFLSHLKAREGQRDQQNLFDVGPAVPDASPSVKSVGIFGQMTGSRADIILSDDVEVSNNSYTQVMRDKLSDAVREFDAILKPLPTSRIIYLGTPQNEMSLYNDLQERGYKACILPARYPDAKQRAIYGDRLFKYLSDDLVKDPSLEGKPTDPQRFDEEDLQRRELSYGKAGFMLQFMLDTSLSDADKYPLRLRDFNVGMFAPDEAPMKINWLPDPTKKVPVDLVPMLGLKGDAWFYYFSTATELTKYAHKILVVDPSGRGKDETGYAVLYCLNGYIYLMEAGGLLGGYSDVVLNKLSNVAKKHKVKEVVVEGNFGDGMYTKLLTPVLNHVYPNCGITEVKSKGQKEMRIIDTLEPVLGNHKLCVTPECIKRDFESVPEGDYKYALFYQLTRITRDRGSLIHDDRLDALAIGVNYLNDFMGVNEDEGIKELTTEWLEKSMESFMRTATHTSNGWTVTSNIDQEGDVYSSINRDSEDYHGYNLNTFDF